jgi:hypothetical protein
MTRGLDVHTTLTWDPPAGRVGDIAGYYILVRETSEPIWQRKLWVGNVNEYRLEGFSKDDYFFAVQSVGRDGHESEIAFTLPRNR